MSNQTVRSAVLYSSRTKLTDDHIRVSIQPELWVRAEVRSKDVEAALDDARPMLDETVLNSVPLD